MKTLIIYDSQYGSTKDYAMKLEQRLKATRLSLKELKEEDIKAHGMIIIGGPVYIDSIKTIKRMNKFAQALKQKTVFCFGVGLTEVTDEYVAYMKEKAMKDAHFSCDYFTMLKGRMNVKSLKFRHRIIIKMVATMLSKKKEPLTEKEKGIIAVVEHPIEALDYDALERIVHAYNEAVKDGK